MKNRYLKLEISKPYETNNYLVYNFFQIHSFIISYSSYCNELTTEIEHFHLIILISKIQRAYHSGGKCSKLTEVQHDQENEKI
jgi:hypothetical protein